MKIFVKLYSIPCTIGWGIYLPLATIPKIENIYAIKSLLIDWISDANWWIKVWDIINTI